MSEPLTKRYFPHQSFKKKKKKKKNGVGGGRGGRKTGLIFLASHVYERREKTGGEEEEEEWRGEGDQDVRPRLPLPASAARVYRWLVSHQVSVQVGQEEEEDTKKTGRRNHIHVVDERQAKKRRGVT